MFSIVPAAFPILKQPALTPPTVAGPMIHFPFALARAAIRRDWRSGIPSAITAIVRMVGMSRACTVTSYAERWLAKLTSTSASGKRAAASARLVIRGMRISFVPQNSFSNPPRSGVMRAATDGSALRHR